MSPSLLATAAQSAENVTNWPDAFIAACFFAFLGFMMWCANK